jgi:hypothetical protein
MRSAAHGTFASIRRSTIQLAIAIWKAIPVGQLPLRLRSSWR